MRKSKSLLLSLIVAAGLTTLMGANVFANSSLKELTVNGKTDSGDSTVVNLSPVSYTHLDVYKRQHQSRGGLLHPISYI